MGFVLPNTPTIYSAKQESRTEDGFRRFLQHDTHRSRASNLVELARQ